MSIFKEDYNKIAKYMEVCVSMSEISKCAAHKVACILVKNDNIFAIGVNGTLPGKIDCNQLFEKVYNSDNTYYYKKYDLNQPKSLTGNVDEGHHEWSLKNEIHAEMNALARANQIGISTIGSTAYTTLSPCFNCAKMLASFGIKEIIYLKKYKMNKEVIEFLKNVPIKITDFSELKELWK